MRISGTFKTSDFKPAALDQVTLIETALPMGVATLRKTFQGQIAGTSTTLFTAAFDQTTGQGTYVAMEAFQGSLAGRDGSFNFVHSATTSGHDRTDTFFLIVPNSGTAALQGITGGGGMAIDPDGTHRLWFDVSGPDWDA